MKIIIKVLESNKTFELECAEADTIGTLQDFVADRARIPKNKQRLIYQGKILKEGTIASNNLTDGCMIHAVTIPDQPQPEQQAQNSQTLYQTDADSSSMEDPNAGNIIFSFDTGGGGGQGGNNMMSSFFGPFMELFGGGGTTRRQTRTTSSPSGNAPTPSRSSQTTTNRTQTQSTSEPAQSPPPSQPPTQSPSQSPTATRTSTTTTTTTQTTQSNSSRPITVTLTTRTVPATPTEAPATTAPPSSQQSTDQPEPQPKPKTQSQQSPSSRSTRPKASQRSPARSSRRTSPTPQPAPSSSGSEDIRRLADTVDQLSQVVTGLVNFENAKKHKEKTHRRRKQDKRTIAAVNDLEDRVAELEGMLDELSSVVADMKRKEKKRSRRDSSHGYDSHHRRSRSRSHHRSEHRRSHRHYRSPSSSSSSRDSPSPSPSRSQPQQAPAQSSQPQQSQAANPLMNLISSILPNRSAQSGTATPPTQPSLTAQQPPTVNPSDFGFIETAAEIAAYGAEARRQLSQSEEYKILDPK
ncbi:hypothetical protein BLNAU_4448 [Blattamonas nauphoetae]|uniref:Ubiquitin-like domain-containing protein n=1 Tax=Blattamonas nauphoetae TaxID=2049346 RepID=A0ABQ9Y9X6_9EUKA|nr:hypothetical protein BLNAU_4448 [Blattamonas nauphoetae]